MEKEDASGFAVLAKYHSMDAKVVMQTQCNAHIRSAPQIHQLQAEFKQEYATDRSISMIVHGARVAEASVTGSTPLIAQ